MTWLTPAELDQEAYRWRRMKPNHGGWDQPRWVLIQEVWRLVVTGGNRG